MGSAGLEESGGVGQINAAADVETARKSRQGRARRLLIARTEHNDMTSAQPVIFEKFGKPAAGLIRDKIRPQSLRILRQGTAHNLFDLAFMEIDARPEHAVKIRRASAGSKIKKSDIAGVYRTIKSACPSLRLWHNNF
jgi:hypothetical protein